MTRGLLLLILSSTSCLAQFSENEPDVAAVFPGGFEAFYKELQRKMVYPPGAIASKIEGRVFVEFEVSAAGLIVPSSINTMLGLSFDCDNEAVRAIGQIKQKWKAAIKDGQPVAQRFVLPVVFRLGPTNTRLWPEVEPTLHGAKFKVISKRKEQEQWPLYKDWNLKTWRAYVPVDDSVQILGWGPNVYAVTYGKSSGYLSIYAIESTPELVDIAAKAHEAAIAIDKMESTRIEEHSKRWAEAFKVEPTDEPVADVSGLPLTFLKLSTNRSEITVGECAELELAFWVNDENKERLRFYDLGRQLQDLTVTGLDKPNCWTGGSEIETVESEMKKTADADFSVYVIYQRAYCPTSPGEVNFPTLTLEMEKMKKPPSEDREALVQYKSKPVNIKVIPPPEAGAFDLVGQFILRDTIMSNEFIQGKVMRYEVTVSGRGLLYPLSPPNFAMDNGAVELIDEQYNDTLHIHNLYSSKTFVYALRFDQPGKFDFSSKIKLKTYDPVQKQPVVLTAKATVDVLAGTRRETLPLPLYSQHQNMIVVDMSRSMLVEDYEPNRLGAVVHGIAGFLSKRKTYDVGMLAFGREVLPVNIAGPNSHYDTTKMYPDHDLGRGTAIGNALWIALTRSVEKESQQKIVVIGDGDNNAGNIHVKKVTAIAKKQGVKVYTIGIGSAGKVPFGVDEHGNKHMVENTFSDKDFKRIALLTGGKYYHAKDVAHLTQILREILPE